MSVRVVLDTNCIVSALLFSGQKMLWLRHAWQRGNFTPIFCKETAEELILVLNYPKFKLSQDEQYALLADILPYAETFGTFKTSADLPQIRDSKDQIFLNLAVASKADALVSGDRDLLTIKDSFTTPPIMTLSEFEAWLKVKQKAQ